MAEQANPTGAHDYSGDSEELQRLEAAMDEAPRGALVVSGISVGLPSITQNEIQAGNSAGLPHHPHCLPRFCCSSQPCSGAKYSSIGRPDISRLPVNASSASGHGRDAPIASIWFNRAPTCLLP